MRAIHQVSQAMLCAPAKQFKRISWILAQFTLEQLAKTICLHFVVVYLIGRVAAMFMFQLLIRKKWRHKQFKFWMVWPHLELPLSVELLLSHLFACTCLGYVTAVVWSMHPRMKTVYWSAQIYVHQSGLWQIDSCHCLDCHLCLSVDHSRVLPQQSVVSMQLTASSSCTHTHMHTHTLIS